MQGIYDLDVSHDVNDYLITNQVLANSLDRGTATQYVKEKLLVCQSDDDLLLSLYLHDGVIERLRKDDPVLQLYHGNLEDFCLALEGISHFLYLVWNASYQRSVTIFEMELQAEIDKFIIVDTYLAQQSRHPPPGQLRQLLFESISFRKDLPLLELQRYRDASYYAEKYCWHLESSYLSKGRQQEMLRELRRFYRLSKGDKIRRIDHLH